MVCIHENTLEAFNSSNVFTSFLKPKVYKSGDRLRLSSKSAIQTSKDLIKITKLVEKAKKELGGLQTNEEILQKIESNNKLINSFKSKTKVSIQGIYLY